MKRDFSYKSYRISREKKVPKGSFFSLFAVFALFLLCSCSFWKSSGGKVEWERKSSDSRMARLEKNRMIRFLLVEQGEYILAQRAVAAAGEQLGLEVRLVRTFPEHVYPLLRADKADLAFGVTPEEGELKRFRLQGHSFSLRDREGKEHFLFFCLPSGSEELRETLEKAFRAAAADNRISFEDLVSPLPELSPKEKEKPSPEKAPPATSENRKKIVPSPKDDKGSSRGKKRKKVRSRVRIVHASEEKKAEP